MVPADIASQDSSFKQAVPSDQQNELPLADMSRSGAAPAHDPGGKVRIKVKAEIRSEAVFGGKNNEYRYRLSRIWDDRLPRVMFVMMNPSTADPVADDPTVAKCGRFARAWTYGGLLVGNTFAYRATKKKQLSLVEDPVGPDNDSHLVDMAQQAKIVVFAYGQPHVALRARGIAVAQLLRSAAKVEPYVLRLSKDGTPYHPLYLPETLQPILWKP
jgi:hypothetical protein